MFTSARAPEASPFLNLASARIAPGQQERIFSRFYRADGLDSHISGLGIGLYISKEIVSRHKGKLTVESEIGKGSVFVVRLPV